MGSKKRPFYRLVAADSRYQRDGRFLEILGYYDPMEKPFKFVVDREKILKWLEEGAQLSKTAESLLRREGIVQEFNQARQSPPKDDAGKKTPQAKTDTKESDGSDAGESGEA